MSNLFMEKHLLGEKITKKVLVVFKEEIKDTSLNLVKQS